MKHFLPFLLSLAGINALFAQNTQPRILCGNEIFSTLVREKYPALQTAFDQTFENTKQKGTAAERSPLNIKVEVFYNDDPLDLVENFMDYSSETCMNMFTKGQVELMRNVLTGPRSGLLENTSVNAPSVHNLNWSVSPNPSEGLFSLKIESDKSQEVVVSIFNLEGKMMLEQVERSLASSSQRLSFDGGNWPAGMYFVVLKTEGGRSVRKVVKR